MTRINYNPSSSVNISNLEISEDISLTGVAGFESKNQTANIIGLSSDDQVVFDYQSQ